jgi:hypothetical protein
MSGNYIKFGPQEMIVQFAADRGELKSNDNGEYFLRTFSDGRRFTCASPELERRLLDLDYRAGEQVGITRQTRNRSVIWKVRLIEPAPPPSESSPRPAARPIPMRTPPAIPEAKYATAPPPTTAQQRTKEVPPTAWPEVETPTKPVARATENRTQALAHALDPIFDEIEQCVLRATDIICKAQKRAVEHGCPTISLEVVQDLACTIIIQEGKAKNIQAMNRNQSLRANGGADPWSH